MNKQNYGIYQNSTIILPVSRQTRVILKNMTKQNYWIYQNSTIIVSDSRQTRVILTNMN